MNSKNHSREKIINTATRLFQMNGYNATGLNEILKESESPKGSLYYYFPNGKEQLALEAIQSANKSIKEKLQAALDKYSDPENAINHLIGNIITDLEKENKLQDISVSLIALETYASSEPLREACKKVFASLSGLYADKLVQNGFSKQRAEQLGMIIEIMIEGAITVSVTRKDTVPLAAVSHSIDVLLSEK
ncbi:MULTISPECIES: TetR/AcrR family transcriptional regulator [unclassified Sporolactobacillus]|uniref:TetR/AcrR family transcriptional regulator n=1 Tax=unclassified Sporolactobacillus TaxID=2628533 RepID=UPI002367EF34|nr:TetR/AcrR family transcriptional regulator [Sporolactobacillus sp. CQH2019]MDD9150732.1 TetR/AcrR family transcriptional regulator [Sporolactobacillus sp. CQH2019]